MEQKNTTTKFKHEGKEKKVYVKKMFDDIAPNYDFLNHLLSFGLDIYWRKKFIKSLKINHNYKIVDLACGTGDVGFEILNINYEIIVPVFFVIISFFLISKIPTYSLKKIVV